MLLRTLRYTLVNRQPLIAIAYPLWQLGSHTRNQ